MKLIVIEVRHNLLSVKSAEYYVLLAFVRKKFVKLVINAMSARRGGGQTYLVNLLKHLDDFSGTQILILAPDSLSLPDDPRVSKISLNFNSDNPFSRSLWEHFIAPRLLKKMGADIFFCPGGLVNTPKIIGCKTVTMFRNMIPFDTEIRSRYPVGYQRLRNWILERAMLKSMIGADLVIFISDFARGVIEKRAGKPLKNAVTIPHGLTEHFKTSPKKVPSRPEWLPNSEYLLYVSIFDVYKRQLEIVQGFHLLKQLRKTSEKLILAGHNSNSCGEKVRSEILRLGLKDDVILTGNIPYQELPNVYHHAKLNIFASECENCPNILLEALGAGRPLLVSNRQPMPEFGGDAVIYFDPSSPQDFADKVVSFIDDRTVMDVLAAKASERSLLYDWKNTASKTWAALEELCEKRA